MRLLACLLFLVSQGAFAQRTAATLDCKFTGKDFVYDCAIQIKRDGQPVSGLNLLVGADMPRMPMAHNVKPVKAQATKTPGEYRAKLDLEMTGEWVVKLRLAGPVRDQLVLHYEFDERGARPVRRSGRSPRK